MNMDKVEETCRWGVESQGPWGPLFFALDPNVDKKKYLSRDRNLTKIMPREDILYLKVALNNWGLNGRQSVQGYILYKDDYQQEKIYWNLDHI